MVSLGTIVFILWDITLNKLPVWFGWKIGQPFFAFYFLFCFVLFCPSLFFWFLVSCLYSLFPVYKFSYLAEVTGTGTGLQFCKFCFWFFWFFGLYGMGWIGCKYRA